MKNLVFVTTLFLSFSAAAVRPNHSVAINAGFEADLQAICQTQRQGVNAYATSCIHKNFEAGFEVSINNSTIEGHGTLGTPGSQSAYGFCNVIGSLQANSTAVVKTSCFSNQD